LESFARHALARPADRLMHARRRLVQVQPAALRAAQQRFELLRTRLAGANPELPLERGYAIVTLNGHAVRDAASVSEGAQIEAKVQRGKLVARVEGKDLNG
jgi:exonuclease VII large subunit